MHQRLIMRWVSLCSSPHKFRRGTSRSECPTCDWVSTDRKQLRRYQSLVKWDRLKLFEWWDFERWFRPLWGIYSLSGFAGSNPARRTYFILVGLRRSRMSHFVIKLRKICSESCPPHFILYAKKSIGFLAHQKRSAFLSVKSWFILP